MNSKKIELHSPVDGKSIPLNQVNDQVFASGMMGQGVAFQFDGNTICSPMDGEVVLIAATKHAIGLKADNGAELLLHVGLDTVNLNGQGFDVLVKPDSRVKAGDPLLKIDRKFMQEKHIDLTTPLICTSMDYDIVTETPGPVKTGQVIAYISGQEEQSESQSQAVVSDSAPAAKAQGKYGDLIGNIMTLIGGQDNLTFHTHCITRLRFNVKDKNKVQLKNIENTRGVVGAQWSGDQLQIIIGQEVGNVYNQICDVYHLGSGQNQAQEPAGKKKFSINTILDAITGSITPLLPLMVAGGLIKVITILLKTFSIVPLDNPTYLILSFVGDAAFYFLPVFTAWSAARKFNTSIPLAMLLGAMLIHPNFISYVSEGTSLNFLGLPVPAVSYTSQILPTILCVWLLSYVEKLCNKIVPSFLKFSFGNLLPILIMIPVTLCIVGPIGGLFGQYLGDFMNFLYDHLGFFGFGLFAALYPFLVMTGMHTTLVPILFNIIATNGFVVFPSIAFTIPNFCQGIAALVVSLKTKDKDLKELAASTSLTALVAGVTEPAMYGVNLKYKTPMIGVCIGAFVGGCAAGLMHVKLYTLVGTSGIFALAGYIGEDSGNFVCACIATCIAIAVTFIATWILYRVPAKTAQREVQPESAAEMSVNV